MGRKNRPPRNPDSPSSETSVMVSLSAETVSKYMQRKNPNGGFSTTLLANEIEKFLTATFNEPFLTVDLDWNLDSNTLELEFAVDETLPVVDDPDPEYL